MDYQKIKRLAESFWEREKTDISPNDILKNMAEIKAWAWCTGMGSETDIYFIKKNGGVFHYDHYKHNGHGKQVDAFYLLQEMLREQGGLWTQIRCMYSNNLYIRPTDKAWLELLQEGLYSLFGSNPYACMEYICRELEGNNNI